MPDLPNDDMPQTFEGSLAQLQQIVHELEDGNLGLEPSLSRFDEGIRLLRNCYLILEKAEQKIEILIGTDPAGSPVMEVFDASATFEGSDKSAKKPGRRRGGTKGGSVAGEASAPPESTLRDEGGLF